MISRILKVFGTDLAPYLIAFLVAAFATVGLRRVLAGKARTAVTWIGVIASTIALAVFCGKAGVQMPQVASDSPHARGVDVMKGALSITAVALVLYEIKRIGQRRPIAERWKKFVGVTLGVAGILFYFNSLKFGYPHYYHRWDQYHYYMGAKYFPEIGYDGLYKCTAIAQNEIDTAQVDVEGNGKMYTARLGAEVRKSDKKIRNLSGDNLLMKVDDLLANPEQCTSRFSPERWEAYKRDVLFFSSQCYVDGYWTQMQQDHGYNPPPVWTIAGKFLGNLYDDGGVHILGKKIEMHQRRFMQGLALVDVLYLLSAFAAIYWAFGWRIFAMAAIFFGTQSSAPFYWTGGALLRQDWLFFFVLSACLARKKYFALSAAAMVYAGLLRVFPGLVVIGWLIVAGWHIAKYRSMKKEHVRMLLGGTVAAAVLILASIVYVGKPADEGLLSRPKEHITAGALSYKKFVHHTLNVHDKTPLTNHMGLRVLLGHDVGFDKESGRMRYVKDGTKVDPFETWKTMRVQRYEDYKPVAYALLLSTFFACVVVLRRLKKMWVAQAISGVWIILLSQLTCYYYSYMLLQGALTRLRRDIEVYILAFGAISQLGWRTITFNDDRYDYLTLISLILSYVLLLAFAPREMTKDEKERVRKKLPVRTPILQEALMLSGYMLGAIIAVLPGAVMVIMAVVRKDWSSVLIGGLSIAAGVGLYIAGKRKRDSIEAQKQKPQITNLSPSAVLDQ